jgi:hypothetical protein
MMGQNGGNQNRLLCFTRLISKTTFLPITCCAALISFST